MNTTGTNPSALRNRGQAAPVAFSPHEHAYLYAATRPAKKMNTNKPLRSPLIATEAWTVLDAFSPHEHIELPHRYAATRPAKKMNMNKPLR
eukprot:CAMPEP_0206243006 /NCGR_PEP_ID=MMETSP0047_2-20121206/17369_1 /ASSEMBLY_ACC=CAM_ASM_000192 /TAXON_ID=195065 /ORGANISM="Chroomonas mesostigmatica_cf, Strain CCMP1168" /LENGTH=90 /DNA_ID=CAMNT_0053668081 /DNA_START=269 /DNA_END=538 /DNA_ORIENTATION=-